MKKRSVASVVILTIITCGIYGVYWTYVTCRDLQAESGKGRIPPVATTLLMLFVEMAGGALLGLDCDETINAIKEKRGVSKTDNMVLWIVLGALIPIVTMALIQYEINQLPPAPTSNGDSDFNHGSDDNNQDDNMQIRSL